MTNWRWHRKDVFKGFASSCKYIERNFLGKIVEIMPMTNQWYGKSDLECSPSQSGFPQPVVVLKFHECNHTFYSEMPYMYIVCGMRIGCLYWLFPVGVCVIRDKLPQVTELPLVCVFQSATAQMGKRSPGLLFLHYIDVIMGTIASQITSLTIVYSTVYSDADQRKYQSSASLAFVRGIHRRRYDTKYFNSNDYGKLYRQGQTIQKLYK